MTEAIPNIQCPSCGSERIWKDGTRYARKREVQRYLCRSCGHRFSNLKVKVNVFKQSRVLSNSVHDLGDFNPVDIATGDVGFQDSAFTLREDVGSHDFPIVGKAINGFLSNNKECRVCASKGGAKNLVEVEAYAGEKVAGAIKGFLVTYEAKLVLKGLKPQTILQRLRFLQLIVKRGADLSDPVSVFKTINHAKKYDPATKQVTDRDWANGSKVAAAQAYKSFCEIVGIQIPKEINFDKWSSNRQQKLPWLPLESEIDTLTAGCSKKIAAFLRLLKETWCRCGEAWRLEWTDVDVEHNIVTINSPEKGGLPRQFKVSSKLIAMLNALPKKDHKVFGSTLNKLRQNFIVQRARTAHKLQNPRIKKITFHTLRHWGATMEYHRTKDILHVQERLGHKSITSTLVYTHLMNFEDDEYHVRTSKTLKEDEELIEAGFEYVTERRGVKIYRKRK